MSRIREILSRFFERAAGFLGTFKASIAFWEAHSALFLAFLASAASLLSFVAGGQEAVNDYLNAMVFQMGHEQTAAIPDVMVIKKDERTSSLIGENPGRREFASIIGQLGQSRRVEDPNATVTSINLAELQFGFFPGGEKPTTVSSILDLETTLPATATGFLRFTEKLARVPEFLAFPQIAFQKGPKNASDSEEMFREAQRKAVLTFHGFLQYASLQWQFRVWPKPGVLFGITAKLKIEQPPDFPIPAARVVALDFLLQGRKDEVNDSRLEAAIASSEVPVVLAAQTQVDTTAKQEIVTVSGPTGATAESGNGAIYSEVVPEKRFESPHTHRGYINVSLGNRGYVDRIPLFQYLPNPDRLVPAFALMTAALALDSVSPTPEISYVKAMQEEFQRILPLVASGAYPAEFRFGDRVIPLDNAGRMSVYYFGSSQPNKFSRKILHSASFFEVFERDLLEGIARERPESAEILNPKNAYRTSLSRTANYGNRICLLGPFERSDFDFYHTPLSLKTPYSLQSDPLMGVEIHANAVLTILKQRFIRPPDTRATALLVVVLTMLLGLILDYLKPIQGALLTGASMAGVFGFGYYSFNSLGQVFLMSPFLLSLPLTWASSALLNYYRQRLKANVTKAMFQKFVSADVVQYMLDHPDLVKPGGQKVELTIFFSDVAGFTSISEALTPEELVVLLNEYLGAMTDILFKHGGTLDKFIGDAVMGFWNYPRAQEDHAIRACLCALEMQRKITELQKGWAKRGLPKVSARAGMNTAQVVVGYMGSAKAQISFTCMGDGVNLASRLEGANKEYGTALMVSDATYQKAKDHVTARFLDFLAVKGKKEPVKVHELVSEKGKEPFGWAERVGMYDRAIQLHLDRKWDEAIAQFEELLARWPDDGPSKTYIGRCHEYKENPPPPNWDGSYHLTHK